ncbi:pyridoxamine 5'-phosphate oxidase family protein [Methanospirillum sp. J.3.6.1-F.2.7.3]|jgi:predicted pyridoxine 5'-phosphate oxidase superfamily flavin-nucleotide-binding protein|uniref:Pyridoxamine 5'-phosphate oxidase family protein n=2 Tax=Methanospirillum TaxID=2202 RepID=A0A8E7AZK9_9EURY|nr:MULTISPECIES: pyridoxamine 5'-phosphate oxidase family protein [Methanospirillum]MDX8550407.1 pyridoxamine 5'-phosphate oxidase family protein [Methanospirillum hungatei]NLW75831.1 pyridoxamine 5-phosphate oxidase [Methanomicrobiales archaeon]QVV88104.1 pyridoxamine 5'-phosphate oxidase family protein [Methanospirillum sp. J.3.6.1-F.2.7.3]QXO95585.1 pyridoxamine 5'-phosphate oxidase family protein [Methanospirillum hungatei]
MTALTPEIKEAIEAIKVFPLATASKSGIPNVAPMGSVFLIDDETIWIGDNFMQKSLQNVLENPKAAIYVYGPGAKGCYQIKGDITVKTSGEEHAKMKAMIHEKKPNLPAKSLLIFKITDVFECMPGADAGKKLL